MPGVTAIRAFRMRKDQLQVGIPSTRAIAGAELQSDLLVAIRNPQRRTCNRIWLRGSQWSGRGIRRKRFGAVADRRAQQGRPAGGAAFLEFADDVLGDIAYCVNRADHLLLADNDIVE